MTGLQVHPPAGKPPNPQLGALDVGQDTDRAVEPCLQVVDHREAGGMILVAAVREVQTEHIGAGQKQPGHDVGGGT